MAWQRLGMIGPGGLAALLGGFMLGAWLTGAGARWSATGVLTMKANMAAGLLLGGTALMMLGPGTQSWSRRWVGLTAATLVLLLGSLTLSEHLVGWDLGIDQLLAHEAPGAIATASPNRIGPPGSTSLALLGAGLALLGAGRRRIVPYLGLAVILVNLLPAVGFLYNVDEFFSKPRTGIAWPTVLAMMGLGLGLVLTCRDAGPMRMLLSRDAGGRMLRGLLPVALLLPLGLGFLRVLGQNQGLYDTAMGAGLFALSMMVVFSAVLWRSASRLSRADAQQKQVEEALQNSEHRLRVTLEAGAMGTFGVDLVTGEGQWNDVEFQLLGLHPGDAPANPETFFRFVHPDDLEALRAQWQEATRTGKLYAEFRVVRADGQERWLAAKGRFESMDTAGGAAPPRPLRFRGVNYDITDRKQVEESLRAAKTALEQASAAKDQFIAKLSHELRTPLTPVVASLSALARDARLPEDLREDMRLLERNIGLEVHLINDLLDVARIVNGKLELRREPVDVAAVLHEAGRIVASDLDAKSQTLIIETPGSPYWVQADRARLHQVFWNLFKNAIKFSPERARIAVEARRVEGILRIAVKDTGQGIDPADLPRLFRAFEQGGPGQSFGGLGLGLAICRGVVELHGGRIAAMSEGRDKGATFTVELPLLVTAPPSALPSAADRLVGSGPLRILLVEDHEDSARVMRRLLMAEDHQVTWAACVKDALAAAESASFDVVVSDIGLPDGTGYDLMRQLVAAGKKLKGIAVSGYGTTEDAQRALAAGFVEHVTKPVSFDSLHNALLRAVTAGNAAAHPA